MTSPKRIRRVIPDNKELLDEGEDPKVWDVVSGRGARTVKHGNPEYWQLILFRRKEYQQAGSNNKKKNEIARSIMDHIHIGRGRFLQFDKSTKQWFVLPEKVILEKIKQALRDKYVPKLAQARKLRARPEIIEREDEKPMYNAMATPTRSNHTIPRKADEKAKCIPAVPSVSTDDLRLLIEKHPTLCSLSPAYFPPNSLQYLMSAPAITSSSWNLLVDARNSHGAEYMSVHYPTNYFNTIDSLGGVEELNQVNRFLNLCRGHVSM